MTRYKYKLESSWGPRVESPSEIGQKFLQSLDDLGRIHPLVRDWGTIDRDDNAFIGRPVDPLRRNFTPFVEARVNRDDWGRPDPEDGYQLFAITRYYPSSPPDPLAISLSVSAGSKWRNKISFRAGTGDIDPDPAIVTYPLFKSALLTLLSIWPAPWANVRYSIRGQDPPTLPGEPPFPYSGYQMPWMCYLCVERAARVTLPDDILTERTSDGGLLMIATQERFDPTNRQHMAHSRVLAEIMIAHGGDAV